MNKLIEASKILGFKNTDIVNRLAKGKCNSLKDLQYLSNIVKSSSIKNSHVILNDKFSIHTSKFTISSYKTNNSISYINYLDYNSNLFGGFIYVDGCDIKWEYHSYYAHIIVQTYKLKNEYINLK